jgi:hypothetical protein
MAKASASPQGLPPLPQENASFILSPDGREWLPNVPAAVSPEGEPPAESITDPASSADSWS